MDGTPFLYTLNVACRWAFSAAAATSISRSAACSIPPPPPWFRRHLLLGRRLPHTAQLSLRCCAQIAPALPPAPHRQELWEDLEPQFKAAIESFTMLATTDAYIPPDKDPWLFF